MLDLFVLLGGFILATLLSKVGTSLLHKKALFSLPSHCLQCKQALPSFNHISQMRQLLSPYSCPSCSFHSSPFYPTSELLITFSIYLAYLQIGVSWELILGIGLVIVLALSVLTDMRSGLILDKVTLPAIALFAFLRIFIGEHSILFYYLGAGVGFLLLLLIAVFSRGGMGGGDIKLYTAIGFVLGPWYTLMSLFIASFLAAICGMALILAKKKSRKESLIFGPFIAFGAFVSYLYGSVIWDWYRQW
ncbi:prepilin peptidase [Bacillus horti]|uniref:Leader peptidase (Prepilin peptidase)/N-methyltransferase n=1 Tax=Caldalkalibacillus horti TaxID=77523 RepID=A0ABT9VUJ1_9BACI|nr:A24 family peptidase [Bacillus horti]MDQ0164295.1 leader peptidase (prepilin peptidase)/N-methyltransferase [Bacillus horti]